MKNAKQAHRFIQDVCRAMERSAHNHAVEHDIDFPGKNEPSLQKEMYGNTWKFFFGVSKGIDLMEYARRTDYDRGSGEKIDHGVSDDSWQEHYGKYGYGPYGGGLTLGKRLAVYNDTEFTFVEPESEDANESKFNFIQ